MRSALLVGVCLVSLITMGCRSSGPDDPGQLSGVGAACETDATCRAGLTCELIDTTITLLGSTCTRACTIDEDCPSDSRCGPYRNGVSDSELFCMQRCDRTMPIEGQCRNPDAMCAFDGVCGSFRCTDGFVCDSGRCDVTTGECRSGANPAARAESACTNDDDCRPPNGTCIGTCNQPACDRGGEYACASGETCGAGSLSDTADVLTYSCDIACTPGLDALTATNGGACRAGRICVPPEADPGGLATAGRCAYFTGGFVTGTASANVGDPCTTSAQCPSPFGYGLCLDGRCALRFCATSVFEGADPCLPNMRCVTGEVPAGYPRVARSVLRSGGCVFPCNPGACPSGLVCDMTTNACQPDCRPDPSICPARTMCDATGACT